MSTNPISRYGRLLVDGAPRYVRQDAPDGGVALLSAAPWHGGADTGQSLAPPGADAWLCPVEPTKIIGIGRNYRAHAAELSNEVPQEPLMFFKPPSSLLGPNGRVELPPESQRVDYEGELAVIIGRRTRRVSKSEAASRVFGYAIACDVTARDLQRSDKQWTRGKGFDTFCPIGPHVVPLRAAGALSLRLRIGGELRQDGNTRDMIFDVPELISYASQCMTLEPGDVILTGTPEGVGPLESGDRVEVQIEALGSLCFEVGSEP
jgi:2-keto-4-pentenoate hydratase/2-oxohepta-3-ene-1,7-dioic acid hydratase in catechol pathway